MKLDKYDDALKKVQTLLESQLKNRLKAGIIDPEFVKKRYNEAKIKGGLNIDPLELKVAKKKYNSKYWNELPEDVVKHLQRGTEDYADTLQRQNDIATTSAGQKGRLDKVKEREKAWKEQYNSIKKSNKGLNKNDRQPLPEIPRRKPGEHRNINIEIPGPVVDFINYIKPKSIGWRGKALKFASTSGTTIPAHELHKKLPSLIVAPSYRFVKSETYRNLLDRAKEAAGKNSKLSSVVNSAEEFFNKKYVNWLQTVDREVSKSRSAKPNVTLYKGNRSVGSVSIDTPSHEEETARLLGALSKHGHSDWLDKAREARGEKGWIKSLRDKAHKEYREKHGIGENEQITGKHVKNIRDHTINYIRNVAKSSGRDFSDLKPAKKMIINKIIGKPTDLIDVAGDLVKTGVGTGLTQIHGRPKKIDITKHSTKPEENNMFEKAEYNIKKVLSDYTKDKIDKILDRKKEIKNKIAAQRKKV